MIPVTKPVASINSIFSFMYPKETMAGELPK
jgi:hypothetical protein